MNKENTYNFLEFVNKFYLSSSSHVYKPGENTHQSFFLIGRRRNGPVDALKRLVINACRYPRHMAAKPSYHIKYYP